MKHAYIVGFMGKMSAKHVIGRLGIAQAIMHYVYNYDSVILSPNPPSEPPTHRLRSSTSTHYLPSILLGFRLDFGTGRSTTAHRVCVRYGLHPGQLGPVYLLINFTLSNWRVRLDSDVRRLIFSAPTNNQQQRQQIVF